MALVSLLTISMTLGDHMICDFKSVGKSVIKDGRWYVFLEFIPPFTTV